ncbi:hypothetical protein [Nocardiopsis dassonvillei]|uniref:hypothetical protein n=1 Tax=Nocardiopsis dassonvillei TaxID=2014 RepID=UPI00362DCFEC
MSSCGYCGCNVQGSGFQRDGIVYCGTEHRDRDAMDLVAKLMTNNPNLLRDAASSDDD